MPSSHHKQITKIIDFIIRLNPQSILDVGAGFGKYGVLCREYLELWDGRYEYTFKRRIDCVEAFGSYITPLHKYIYNNIYVDDVLKLIDKKLNTYDLVMLIDVLEHFDKATGQNLLQSLLSNKKIATNLLISTPKDAQAQGAGFGNEYEIHRSQWSREELDIWLNPKKNNKKKRAAAAVRSSPVVWIDDDTSHICCYISSNL